MTAIATGMMNGWMNKAKVAKLSELLDMAVEMEVRLIACQMTMDVMGIKKEELIDGIEIRRRSDISGICQPKCNLPVFLSKCKLGDKNGRR